MYEVILSLGCAISVSVIKPISSILHFGIDENKLAVIFQAGTCQMQVPPGEVAGHREKSVGTDAHLSHLCETGWQSPRRTPDDELGLRNKHKSPAQ